MSKRLREQESASNVQTVTTPQQVQAVTPIGGLLTPKQVAAQANYRSEVSILRAFRRGELAGFKLNARTIRFHPNDVAKWFGAARIE